ncbi:hypothetical protein ABW21_db0203400 [Orbilia brochopaga]|nr:hypothetical protein ABW21_db0203400 [Drechslerella brochopaga]
MVLSPTALWAGGWPGSLSRPSGRVFWRRLHLLALVVPVNGPFWQGPATGSTRRHAMGPPRLAPLRLRCLPRREPFNLGAVRKPTGCRLRLPTATAYSWLI